MSPAVDYVLEHIFSSYIQINPLDDAQMIEFRVRVGAYISKLSDAGKRNPEELALYGLEYLKELREGPDPHFSGC